MSAAGTGQWGDLLTRHARRYPRGEPVDLYKLLHQATRGAEHAVPSEAAAGARLGAELGDMGAGPAEPLIDSIRADGEIARVHLRPWQAAGLDPEILLQAFLATAVGWRENLGELEEALREAVAAAGDLGSTSREMAALAEQVKEAGYPPVHHSAAFVREYRPAYRVVAARFLPAGLRFRPQG